MITHSINIDPNTKTITGLDDHFPEDVFGDSVIRVLPWSLFEISRERGILMGIRINTINKAPMATKSSAVFMLDITPPS